MKLTVAGTSAIQLSHRFIQDRHMGVNDSPHMGRHIITDPTSPNLAGLAQISQIIL